MLDPLFDYFATKYGDARAEVICSKILPGVGNRTLEQMKALGDKWHMANMMFRKSEDR